MTRITRTCAALVALAACVALPRPAVAIDIEEQRARLLLSSRQLEEQIARSGELYGDSALDAYLQTVLDRLFPERAEELRVHVIRDLDVNAFAMPSGAIYVNTGALLRIRDEAELAALVGHEAAHVTMQHCLAQVGTTKSLAMANLIVATGVTSALGFDPLLEQIAANSTLAGFSREKEREADRIGHERSVLAGYDSRAASTLFDRMQREMKALGKGQGFYLFAGHPRLASRMQDLQPGRDVPAGVSHREEYLAATAAVRGAALQELRSRQKSDVLIFLLGDESMAADSGPSGYYLLGEGYRLRGKPGDDEFALQQYRKSTQQYPEFAPAWNALGRYYASRGDGAAAIPYLQRFLALDPDAREAPFARQMLAEATRPGTH